MKTWTSALSILILLASLNPVSAAPSKKYLMAALGDSITAGFLADTHVKKISNPAAIQADSILDHPPFTTKANDSWASGQSIHSHFMLLKQFLQNSHDAGELTVLNEADPGSKAQDLEVQALNIKSAMASGKYQSLKYVVLFIGANDACSKKSDLGTPERLVKEGLKKAFQILSEIKQPEPIRIFMSGIPNIPDLGKYEILHSRTALNFSCHFLRDKILHLCHPILNWKSTEEYEDRVARVENENRILEEASKEAQKEHPQLDIKFSGAIFSAHIDPSMLALDCFHPSREGQAQISEVLWAEQPWFH